MSQLEIERQENNNKPQTEIARTQQNRRILESLLDKHIPDIEIVTHIKSEAFEKHQGWAYQEILNRKYGKVKDTLDINVNIKDLRPSQEEIEQLNARFQPSTIQASTDKTLPEPSNAEQNAIIDADYTIEQDNDDIIPVFNTDIQAVGTPEPQAIEPDKKPDTLPEQCLAFQGYADNNIQADEADDWYNSKPHIIHRDKPTI